MDNCPLSISTLRSSIALQLNQLRADPAKLAQLALLTEVDLTPKPGLVDQNNAGAHRDMNLMTFLQSIAAITPYLEQFYRYGYCSANSAPDPFLMGLRAIGKRCEAAMFAATQGINTHKGAIFAFALLLAALGRLHTRAAPCHYSTICQEVANLCQGMVERELCHSPGYTVGERLYRQYGLTGARGEAQSGYQLVRHIALPNYFKYRQQGYSEQRALWQTMLYLLANNDDTNIVSRGGLDGLNYVKNYARQLLQLNQPTAPLMHAKLLLFDQQLIGQNLSPGGTADLLAVTWFLSHFPS